MRRAGHGIRSSRVLAVVTTLVLVGSLGDGSVASSSTATGPVASLGRSAAGPVPEATATTPARPTDAATPGPDTTLGPPAPRPEPTQGPAVGSTGPIGDGQAGSAVADLVYRVRTRQPVIALTFDDGWCPACGRRILDILVAEHVPATFFVNSMYVRWDPGLWHDIAAAGFVVGNHTYEHVKVTTIDRDAIVADLERNARVFERLTGYPMAPLFRPPYGARNPATDAAAALAGFPTVVVWDTTDGDTAAHPTRAGEIAQATAGRRGSIVLMHVGPTDTPLILEAVIAAYRARGFTFVTVPELLASR